MKRVVQFSKYYIPAAIFSSCPKDEFINLILKRFGESDCSNLKWYPGSVTRSWKAFSLISSRRIRVPAGKEWNSYREILDWNKIGKLKEAVFLAGPGPPPGH